jgi:hypothetical protein
VTPTVTSTVTPSITPSATPAPFAPNQISNLQYWFDAASGSSASSWTNYGLLGGSATQATATFQPAVKTNSVFGSWTGKTMNFVNRDNMSAIGVSYTNYSSSTIFNVMKINSRAAGGTGTMIGWRIWDNGNFSGINNQMLTSAQATPSPISNFTGAYSGATFSGNVGNPLLMSVIYNGNTSQVIELNDTVLTNITGGTNYLSGNTIVFGTNVGVDNANNFEVAEHIVYNKVLTDTEFTQVENYLKTKYQYSSW